MRNSKKERKEIDSPIRKQIAINLKKRALSKHDIKLSDDDVAKINVFKVVPTYAFLDKVIEEYASKNKVKFSPEKAKKEKSEREKMIKELQEAGAEGLTLVIPRIGEDDLEVHYVTFEEATLEELKESADVQLESLKKALEESIDPELAKLEDADLKEMLKAAGIKGWHVMGREKLLNEAAKLKGNDDE